MFNLGNDDKEKLKQNMEEIKEMVNEGQSLGPRQGQGPEEEEFPQQEQEPGSMEEQQAGDGEFGQETPAQDETRSFDKPAAGGQDVQNFDQPGDSGPGQPQPGQSLEDQQELEEELASFEEKFSDGEQQGPQQPESPQPSPQPGQQTGQETQQFENPQQRSKTTKAGIRDSRDVQSLSQEVPAPPESREVNVPEIDRGPLFLKQQKFRDAKQLIDQMMYLSREIEETVNSLEAGIQEDHATERNVREMLKNLEGDRESVEDIISPREE